MSPFQGEEDGSIPFTRFFIHLSMVLSDRDIKKFLEEGKIEIEPLFSDSIQPASVDLHLDRFFLLFNNSHHPFIDVKIPQDDLMKKVDIGENGTIILHQGDFILGNTIEKVSVNSEVAGRLEGKSSLARLGILVHCTGGYLDPGNSTTLTLELHNVGHLPVKLYHKMKIAQMSFLPLSSPCEIPYGDKRIKSKYYGETEPQASRIYLDFENESNKNN